MSSADAKPKPNIILILADDMGYGDIGAFGNPDVQTPHLDRLASESVRLTQQYSGSCMCAPARAALLTGRYPHRTGCIDVVEFRGLDRLALREVTLADTLKSAGYATGLMGKWHLGKFDPRYHPNARGFDEFVGFQGGWNDYWKWRIERNAACFESDGRYLTDVFTDEAVQFLRRHRRRPFFLHVAYNAPHTPLQAPDDDVQPFLETGKFNRGVSITYGMNRRMDRGIGAILDELDRQGLRDNTIVLFTSDNGPWFGGEGEMCCERFNGRFNGSKGTVFEGGIRVPAILRWPAGLEGGRELHEMIHFTDWYSTLLAAAGVTPLQGPALDGDNVLPVLRGEPGQVNTRRFWQWSWYRPRVTCNAAMRDGDWKLVRLAIAEIKLLKDDMRLYRQAVYEPDTVTDILREPLPYPDDPAPLDPLLFNLREDPYEQDDLSMQHPDCTARMLRELETWFAEVEAERATIDDV